MIITIFLILPFKSNLWLFFNINNIFFKFINYYINNINYNTNNIIIIQIIIFIILIIILKNFSGPSFYSFNFFK